jgi:hypothetical protein
VCVCVCVYIHVYTIFETDSVLITHFRNEESCSEITQVSTCTRFESMFLGYVSHNLSQYR